MESNAQFALRIAMIILALTLIGLAIAFGLAFWLDKTSVQQLGQAAFYAGMAMLAIGVFIIMPFQGVGGGGMGSSGDFSRMMMLTAADTDWNALHRKDHEHLRRGLPVAVCLGASGLMLAAGGLATTWIAWSNRA